MMRKRSTRPGIFESLESRQLFSQLGTDHSWLIVRLRGTDQATNFEPISLTDAHSLTDLINNRFQRYSSGLFAFGQQDVKIVYTDVLALPQATTDYNPSSGDPTGQSELVSDIVSTLSNNGWNTNNYDQILTINSFGGGYAYSLGAGKSMAVTANNSNFMPLQQVATHEMLHCLGLSHASSWDAGAAGEGVDSAIAPGTVYEYSDIFDVMGAGQGYLPSTPSDDAHPSAPMKNLLGWMRTGEVTAVTSSNTYRIYAHDKASRTTSESYALKIAKDGNRTLWIESRHDQSTYAMGSGIELRWAYSSVVPGGGGGSNTALLDPTPGYYGWRLPLGQTFTDELSHVSITPISRTVGTSTYFDVAVHLGDPSPAAPVISSLSANATQVASGTTVTFTAAASDTDGNSLSYHWIVNGAPVENDSPVLSKVLNGTDQVFVAEVSVSDRTGNIVRKAIPISITSSSVPAAKQPLTGYVRDGVGNGVPNIFISSGNGIYTRTDSSGYYILAPNSSQSNTTLTPTLTGYTISPDNFSGAVANTATRQSFDFVATQNMYALTGTVTTDGATALPGFIVKAYKPGTSTVVGTSAVQANGNFRIYVPAGYYELHAERDGVSLTVYPTTVRAEYASALADAYLYVTSMDLSGTIFDLTIAGVTNPWVTLRTGGGTSQTVYRLSSQGVNKAFSGDTPAGNQYIWVQPASASHPSWTPTFTNPSSTGTGSNFTKDTTRTYGIQGYVRDRGLGISGATVVLKQGATTIATCTTDDFGCYLFLGNSNGSYTVEVSKMGMTFPAAMSVTIASADAFDRSDILRVLSSSSLTLSAATASQSTTNHRAVNLLVEANGGSDEQVVYTWSKISGPGSVVFGKSAASHTAKTNTAMFSGVGTYVLRVTAFDGTQTLTSDVTVVIDQTAPSVVSSVDYINGTPRIQITFDEDVGASLSLSDLSILNLDNSTTPSDLSVSYNSSTKTATIYLGHRNSSGDWVGLPSNGDYSITFGGLVTDLAGNAVATYADSFFILRGDVNRDRKVDFDDLLLVAQNWDLYAQSYGNGNLDFDLDGHVDFDDLLELAQYYGSSLDDPITVGNIEDDWELAQSMS
jgi:hypothetical protein